MRSAVEIQQLVRGVIVAQLVDILKVIGQPLCVYTRAAILLRRTELFNQLSVSPRCEAHDSECQNKCP